MREQTESSFSVVIPARNAGVDLAQCLAAVRRAFGTSAECIVVDDGSTDRTAAVARAAGAEVVSLPLSSGAAAARNLGAQMATREVLVFIDADCAPHRDAARRLRAIFRDPDVDAVVGAYDERPAARGIVSRFRNLLHAYTHQTAGPAGSTFWTGCGAIRRRVFLEGGGFSESWRYMEDVEFGQRLRDRGGRIRFDASVRVCHLKRWTLLSMIDTDVLRRAVPWTLLLLSRRRVPNVLNLRHSQKASVVLVLLAVLLAAASFSVTELLAGVPVCLALIALLNRHFYAFVRRVDSPIVALAAGPLHLVYFLSAATGLAIGCAEYAIESARSRGRARKEPGVSGAAAAV